MRLTRNIFLLATLVAWSFAPAQSSRTELRSLTVPGVGTWDFNVYLPPGYDGSTERYPVIYLFRGAVDEWLDRTEDASRNGRNIQTITDTLIAEGSMGGVILVMPGFTAMTGPATEADYAFILNTLIPHIDRQYRTLPTRWHRGLDGFSLGGLHMVNLIWRNPERFASAGSYDGTFSLFNFNQMTAAGDRYFARLRPMQFLLHSAAVAPSNLSTNRQFESLLNSNGIPNTFGNLIFSSTSQHNWWNADEHMIRALPYHWSKFQSAPHNVALQWKSDIAGNVAGVVHPAWSVGTTRDSLRTLVDYSRDNGATWQVLAMTASNDSSFAWNTSQVPDGTRYLLRVQVFGDTTYGVVVTGQRFTIDNPANGAPDIAFVSPRKQEIVSGSYSVRWFAEDPEGTPLRISLYGSSDNAATWQLIAADLPNSGSYNWISLLSANGSSFRLKLVASDGSLSSETTSQMFEVRNDRGTIGNVRHIAGHGDGRVTVNMVDPTRFTGHTYRITFDDTGSATKRYSVFDLTKGSYVLQNIAFQGNGIEGPLFDGLRTSIIDFPAASISKDSTRWTSGSSTLSAQVSVPTIYVGSDTVRGIPYPSDYEFRIADRIVDTSVTFLGATATPLRYSVWNITENHKADVVVNELDGDGTLSRFDEVYIVEQDGRGQATLTWVVFFTGDDRTRLPLPGDVFTLKTFKPLTAKDVFEFSTAATGVDEDASLVPGRIELYQNYPNPFNPTTAISYQLPALSEPRSLGRVESIDSPSRIQNGRSGFDPERSRGIEGSATNWVELTVFDVLGKEVTVIVNGWMPAGRHTHMFDARHLASGVYFYRLMVNGTALTKKALLLR